MERIAEKRVGFHCLKLFIINSLSGYEVSINNNILIKYIK